VLADPELYEIEAMAVVQSRMGGGVLPFDSSTVYNID
jgi:hypothetical protein